MGNTMGCGKKEQADTASPTATSSTPLTETKELPPLSQSPHGKSGNPPFLRYLKDNETYISPADAEAMKKSDELGYVTGIASGQIITKRSLLKRGIRAHQAAARRTLRKGRRATKKQTRKISSRGGRRKARRRPAKRRTKRQRRKKRGSRRRR
jgi:hypothetical protein